MQFNLRRAYIWVKFMGLQFMTKVKKFRMIAKPLFQFYPDDDRKHCATSSELLKLGFVSHYLARLVKRQAQAARMAMNSMQQFQAHLELVRVDLEAKRPPKVEAVAPISSCDTFFRSCTRRTTFCVCTSILPTYHHKQHTSVLCWCTPDVSSQDHSPPQVLTPRPGPVDRFRTRQMQVEGISWQFEVRRTAEFEQDDRRKAWHQGRHSGLGGGGKSSGDFRPGGRPDGSRKLGGWRRRSVGGQGRW